MEGIILWGLCGQGNLRFKIDWASLQLEGNLPFLLCFTLYLRAISKPLGAYIRRGDLTEGFLRYGFQGLIHGEAYFRNFTLGILNFEVFPL